MNEKTKYALTLISLFLLLLMDFLSTIVGGAVILSALFKFPTWAGAAAWITIQIALIPYFLWLEED